MTSRGRGRSKSLQNESTETFLLTRVSENQPWDDESVGSSPDSDSALGRRRQSIAQDNFHPDDLPKPGLLQRVFTFMSQSPLLGRPSSVKDGASYGALPNQGSRSQSRDWDMADDHDTPKSTRRRGNSSALMSAASSANLESRQRRDGSFSQSKSILKETSRGSSPMLIAEPGRSVDSLPLAASEDEGEGDHVISVDEDEDVLDPTDNSPYAQVRASVAATDDISASINTPRMWILSLICALLGSATNLFFSLRYPSVAITPVIALVIVHPLGRAWDRLLKRPDDPTETFEYGDRVRTVKLHDTMRSRSKWSRLRLWLAQGRWNGKEHACVSQSQGNASLFGPIACVFRTLFFTRSIQGAVLEEAMLTSQSRRSISVVTYHLVLHLLLMYVLSDFSFYHLTYLQVIVEQTKFYHQDVSIVYQLLLTISTQILGYSFAGLTRRYLVRPPSMIWPGTLMSTAMFTTMHSSENKPANGWSISRWKFFLSVWSGAFAWYFLPGLLMPALSYFSVVTWFAPDNVVVANLVSRSGKGTGVVAVIDGL